MHPPLRTDICPASPTEPKPPIPRSRNSVSEAQNNTQSQRALEGSSQLTSDARTHVEQNPPHLHPLAPTPKITTRPSNQTPQAPIQPQAPPSTPPQSTCTQVPQRRPRGLDNFAQISPPLSPQQSKRRQQASAIRVRERRGVSGGGGGRR